MARSTKKRSTRGRRTKKKTSRIAEGWNGMVERLTPSETTQKVLRGVGWSCLVLTIVVGAMVGIPELRSRAIARDLAFHANHGIVIEFIDRPSIIDGAELERLNYTVVATLGDATSPLQHGGLPAVAEALQATGWFEKIEQVNWTNEGSIEVHGIYATPVAVVRTRDGDVLIDSQGSRLPITYDAGYAPLPVIKNARQAMPTSFGTPWLGGDVQAGLALLKVMYERPWFSQVKSIDVGQFSTNGTLAIRTDTCTILWGRSPEIQTVQEVSTEQKIDYLEFLNDQYGAIDAACGGGELDIRRDVVTTG